MARWDGEKIIYGKDKKSKFFPGWLEIDCGCCGGIEWGHFLPCECRRCDGSGRIFKHIKSKVIVRYPGGSFC